MRCSTYYDFTKLDPSRVYVAPAGDATDEPHACAELLDGDGETLLSETAATAAEAVRLLASEHARELLASCPSDDDLHPDGCACSAGCFDPKTCDEFDRAVSDSMQRQLLARAARKKRKYRFTDSYPKPFFPKPEPR